MGAFVISPLPPVLPEECCTAGPLRSTGATRVLATTDPSVTLSPSAAFLDYQLYGVPCSTHF